VHGVDLKRDLKRDVAEAGRATRATLGGRPHRSLRSDASPVAESGLG
jgi:hypothetical protein